MVLVLSFGADKSVRAIQCTGEYADGQIIDETRVGREASGGRGGVSLLTTIQ
jgi:hypothetical protein